MHRSDVPSGEVLAAVYDVRLAWGDSSHFAPDDKQECRHGDGPTVMRDDAGDPCHIRCGEQELAARLYAERYGDLSPLGLAQELTGHREVRR